MLFRFKLLGHRRPLFYLEAKVVGVYQQQLQANTAGT
jgi:hypothetical protein